jgi:hypothetical protein
MQPNTSGNAGSFMGTGGTHPSSSMGKSNTDGNAGSSEGGDTRRQQLLLDITQSCRDFLQQMGYREYSRCGC